MKPFRSALDFQKHFDTDAKCRAYLEDHRWGKTPCCVRCASVNVTRMKGGSVFQCNEKECRKQSSVLMGTVFENTKIPLTKWFLAIYILSNHSKGMSSMQLASWMGITYKSAWFLSQRIRAMLADTSCNLLSGIVEVDETYVGGKISNKHRWERDKLKGAENKTIVFGALARTGKVITRTIKDATKESLLEAVRSTVRKGTVLVSDENAGYGELKKDYRHAKVNHSKGEYVRGAAHTNSVEGFWNLLKKQMAIHHYISAKHLQRYCDEVAYRYNNRHSAQDTRFASVFAGCHTRLRFKDLIKQI